MLITIVGATGTGKSDLALDIAEAVGATGLAAEVVNADAMQLYRGMDIGTAKLSVGERRGIAHHLFDVLEVTDESSVADYQALARARITAILDRGSVPILVGGSGLYVSSVLYDFVFPGTDPLIRQRLEAELLEGGPRALYDRLTEVDPAAATAIGRHNGRRIVRALEVVEMTGAPFRSGLPDESSLWSRTAIIGLTTARDVLIGRLDARVAQMWSAGLLGEVEELLEAGLEQGATASRAIGYAQAIAQLRGTLTRAEAIEQTRALTRKYARRQVGWFKRYPRTTWVDTAAPNATASAVTSALRSLAEQAEIPL